MKTKYFIPFSFLVLLLFSGCQKLTEDPKALILPSGYFQTQNDLDAATNACYELWARDLGVGGTNFLLSTFGSDDMATHPASNKGIFRIFDQLNATSDMSVIENNWNRLYECVYQTNNVIANYKRVVTVSAADVDKKNAAAAQAYFLRAWSYFRLVHQFGACPLVFDPTLSVETRLPRTPVGDIYNAIVADLKMAISLFPATFPTGPAGSDHANLLAAKTVLADVYLNMASPWPLNLGTASYALAAATAKEVMDANKYTLVPDYATVFTTNDNSECIFAIQFDMTGSRPQRYLGMFAIPENEVAQDGSSGWNDYCSEINFYKNAPKLSNGKPCKRSWQTFYDTLKIRNADRVTFTLTPYNLTGTNRPFYKKFRYGLGVPGAGDACTETANTIVKMNASSNKSTDLYRYPLVLLTYAEAKAMSAGVDQSCYDAINLVRNRAGLPNLMTAPSATAFRDSVVRERAYEFAGENGIRWYDVQRLQLLPTIISQRNTTVENTIVGSAPNAYLAPIPLNEMLRNPTWTQNTGYN